MVMCVCVCVCVCVCFFFNTFVPKLSHVTLTRTHTRTPTQNFYSGAGSVLYQSAMPVTPGVSYPVVVGAGGIGVRGGYQAATPPQGGVTVRPFPPAQKGGSSSFNGLVASGGGGLF